MTVEIPARLEERIDAKARRLRKSADERVIEAIEQLFPPEPSEISIEEWVALLRSAAAPAGVALPDEALSSEALYD